MDSNPGSTKRPREESSRTGNIAKKAARGIGGYIASTAGSAVGAALGGPTGGAIGGYVGGYGYEAIVPEVGEVSSTTTNKDMLQGGGAGGAQADGQQYGYDIVPSIPRNILNRGTTYSGSWKNQYTYTFDFSDDINAIIIPYQEMRFWYPRINNSKINFEGIKSLAYGIQFHKANMDMDLLATTRKRLLTGGTNTLETIDFEPSQNMVIASSDRRTQQYTIAGTETAPYFVRYTDSTFSEAEDVWTRQEVAQHFCKKFSFGWSDLPDQKLYNIQDWTQPGIMIPGPTGLANNASFNSNFQTETNDQYNSTRMMKYTSRPMVCITSQAVPDITGTMKFAFTVRITQELHYTLFLFPDVYDSSEDDVGRQLNRLPTMDLIPGTGNYNIVHNAQLYKH